MKKAIMYGGGNIGRGFIGKVFADSGYEVVFLDIMQNLIDEMNRRGEYTVRIVSNAETVDATEPEEIIEQTEPATDIPEESTEEMTAPPLDKVIFALE